MSFDDFPSHSSNFHKVSSTLARLLPLPWWHIWPHRASEVHKLAPKLTVITLSSPTGNRWDWICWPVRLNPAERIRSALTSSPVSNYTKPMSSAKLQSTSIRAKCQQGLQKSNFITQAETTKCSVQRLKSS